LINSEYGITGQRLGIAGTVAEVFRISRVDYESILTFVTSEDRLESTDNNLLVISDDPDEILSSQHYRATGLEERSLL